LIDEAVQMQVAKDAKIFISKQELKEAMVNMAKQNNMTLENMKKMFTHKGYSPFYIGKSLEGTIIMD